MMYMHMLMEGWRLEMTLEQMIMMMMMKEEEGEMMMVCIFIFYIIINYDLFVVLFIKIMF